MRYAAGSGFYHVHSISRQKWYFSLFNSLPHDKILTWSNLKEFAGNKKEVVQMMKFVLDWFENIVGKGENAGYQHFLLFPQCFQKSFFFGRSLKFGNV